MDLKVTKEKSSFISFKKINKYLSNFFFNNKTKKIYAAIFLISFLLLGFLFGLIASGYFGTFDQPSGRAYEVLRSIGIENSHELKILAQGIIKQNVKIPINYFKGKLSNPEKLTIDIPFDNFQKIEYKRQQAIEKGGLISSGDDYVNAKITHNGETYDVKLRLKGDLEDHWSGDKWSFRIKVKDDKAILGMTVFSIQDPKTRQEMNEWLYQRTLKEEGIIGLRYFFVEVIINGENKGIYALEEHFSKELIESNKRREGLIFKFDEDFLFENSLVDKIQKDGLMQGFYSMPFTTFESEEKILNDSVKLNQYNSGLKLMESFRQGKVSASEIFDKEKWAKYYAIGTILNCPHSMASHNQRLYFNPATSLFEPIGFDGNCRLDGAGIAFYDYAPNCIEDELECNYPDDFSKMILRDIKIYSLYSKELNKFSNKSYMDFLLLKIENDLNKNLIYLYKETSFYYFPLEAIYRSLNQIKNALDPPKLINAYWENSTNEKPVFQIKIANIDITPLNITKLSIDKKNFYPTNNSIIQPRNLSIPLSYNKYYFSLGDGVYPKVITNVTIYFTTLGLNEEKSETVYSFNYPNISERDFIREEKDLSKIIEIDENKKTYKLKSGEYEIKSNVEIPNGYKFIIEAGTNINLINKAMILSYSPVFFEGTNINKIKIYSTDETGQGLTVLNAKEESLIKNTIFTGLQVPNKDGWILTSRVNFYESDVKIENSFFLNSITEDSLNIIRSKFELNNVTFENCFSDCFDGDFVKGIIKNSAFKKCGNDCLDFSGSEVSIEKTSIFDVGDKGISAGEKSIITAKDIQISGDVFIGFASKDLSNLTIDNSTIEDAIYGIVAYQKKSEYGPSTILATNIQLNNCKTSSLIEKESTLILNNNLVLTTEKGVYEKLYGN